MPRNNQFLKAIKRIKDLPPGGPLRKSAEGALDAILMVNLNVSGKKQLAAFIEAVGSPNAAFWSDPVVGSISKKAADETSNGFLEVKHKKANFLLLKQNAAEQRVLLGLAQVEQSVLIEILGRKNEAVCRDYIAAQQKLGNLAITPGWKPAPAPVAIDPNADILTDDAVVNIKKEAAKLLLLELIKNADMVKLAALIKATSAVEVQNAAIALGVPANGAAFLEGALTDGDVFLAANRRYVKEKTKSVDFLTAPNADQELAKWKEILEQEDTESFIEALNKALGSNLATDDENAAKEVQAAVGIRYLQAALARGTCFDVRYTDPGDFKSLLKLINADMAAMKEAISGYDDGSDKFFYDYVTQAVTEENMPFLNASVVQRLISTITDIKQLANLVALEKAEDLNAFKKALEKLGVASPDWVQVEHMKLIQVAATKKISELKAPQMLALQNWIKHSDRKLPEILALVNAKDLAAFKTAVGPASEWIGQEMIELQKAALARALELQVAAASKFGTGNIHPNLMALLKSLPEEKQKEFLGPGGVTALKQLMGATTDNVVAYYLGQDSPSKKVKTKEEVDADQKAKEAIVAENTSNALLSKIHNFELAKAIAQINPPVELTPDMVKSINLLFYDATHNIQISLVVLSDFKADGSFPLFEGLKVSLGCTKEALSAALGITPQNDAIPKAIMAQHGSNGKLIARYHAADTTEAEKAILDVFLRLKTTPNPPAFNTGLGLFDVCRDNPLRGGFIDAVAGGDPHYVTDGNARGLLNQALLAELTDSEYAQLRNAVLREFFEANLDPDKAIPFLGEMSKTLTVIKSQHEPLLVEAKPFIALVADLDALDSSEFDSRVLAQPVAMREHYVKASASISLIVDKLQRNKNTIDGLIATIPKDEKDRTPEMSKILKLLQEESSKLGVQLKELQKVDVAFQHAVERIDAVANRTKSRAYQPNEVTQITDTNKGLLGLFVKAVIGAPPLPAVQPVPQSAVLTRGAKDKIDGSIDIKPEQEATFLVKVPIFANEIGLDGVTPAIGEVQAQYKVSTSSPRSIVNEDGEVVKSLRTDIEIIQAPITATGVDSNSERALLTLAMDAVLESIRSNGPITATNRLKIEGGSKDMGKYLWAAAQLLGAKAAHIDVSPISCPFRPENAKVKPFLCDVLKGRYESLIVLKLNDQKEILQNRKGAPESIDKANVAVQALNANTETPATTKSKWQFWGTQAEETRAAMTTAKSDRDVQGPAPTKLP